MPELFGQKYGWNVLIVLILTVGMFIYLKYCKQGYEIAVVGESENTAKYAGIHVKKVIIRTMAISGAICGIAGFVIVSGASHTISTATAGGRGFTAIIVAIFLAVPYLKGKSKSSFAKAGKRSAAAINNTATKEGK